MLTLDADSMGSQALVQKMTQQLCSRDLQILWVATQQRDNWAKLIGMYQPRRIVLGTG